MVIFKNRHYEATYHKGILCVINRHKKIGRGIRGVAMQDQEANTWRIAIETAIDSQEKHELCRAIYQSIN